MDYGDSIKKSIEEAVKAYEETLKSLFQAQREFKEVCVSYPVELDSDIGEFSRDVCCIIRRWNILKNKLTSIKAIERERIILELGSMQDVSDKKLSHIVFEFNRLKEVGEAFLNYGNSDDEWGEEKEWGDDDDDDDGFIY